MGMDGFLRKPALAAAVEAPTGTERIGSEDHAALEVLGRFAKGFGDVPASLSALRPLALQGDVRVETPLGEGRPVNEFLWNAALSYDLRVLHEQASFPAYLEPLAFVAEFNFAAHLNGPARGESESFVTAGVIYSRENLQVGVALQFPMSGGRGWLLHRPADGGDLLRPAPAGAGAEPVSLTRRSPSIGPRRRRRTGWGMPYSAA